jgi:S-adenosylmethionine hydrolase
MSHLIALTTDFGPSSHYVAQMKGVILSVLPDARMVDVTHAIPPSRSDMPRWCYEVLPLRCRSVRFTWSSSIPE